MTVDLAKPTVTRASATDTAPTWQSDANRYILNLSTWSPRIAATLADYVKTVVDACGDDLVAIILYGSQASGTAETESDIDLFLIVRCNSIALRNTLADLAWQVQFMHDVVISDVVRTLDEYRQMQQWRFPYFQNIECGGVLLWRNPSVPMPVFASKMHAKNS